jgi:hypothetical protein
MSVLEATAEVARTIGPLIQRGHHRQGSVVGLYFFVLPSALN